MKQYRMPLILGSIALILAGVSLILGLIELIQKGMTTNTMFAAIIFVAGSLSGFNLLRLHRQLKNRKPPGAAKNRDANVEAPGDMADNS